MPVTLQYY